MGNTLTSGQSLTNDGWLVSSDGRYGLYLQSDANLVLCRTTNGVPDLGRPYWSCAANAVGNYVGGGRRLGAPYLAAMQGDGNFVLYNADHRTPYWATNTQRAPGQFTAAIQTDGNFVVYTGPPDALRNPIWASNTVAGQGLGLAPDGGTDQSMYCRADAARNYYARFAPLRVKVTDRVLNPLPGRQVSWSISAGTLPASSYVVNDAGIAIRPADANAGNPGFRWTSTSDTNGVATLIVQAMTLPVPGSAQAPPGVTFYVTAAAAGTTATVRFSLNAAGVLLG
ncbi:hypothetical protein [Streptomyces sp. NPDC002082]|uniref:hypothetical protein n=1 Tax=Streptomyces sp. NPDC002082 TaxID=3154772 RepID=UPI00331B4113